MKYNLITIEGNIGAGKTSLARRLADDFNGRLILEQFADNVFLPQFIQGFRQSALAMELFFVAERFSQLSKELPEQELFHHITLMDYLFTKSLLFAKVNLSEPEYFLFQKLFNIINPRLPEPELIIYLHSDVERLMRNIEKRGRDFEGLVKPEYLAQLQETYFDYFRQNPQLRIIILNVTRSDFVNNETHYRQIVELVTQEYPCGIHHFAIE